MKQLKEIAAMLTEIGPAGAVVTLRGQTNPIESAKLLYYMETPEKAKIISELNNGDPEDIVLANEILKAFIRVGEDIPVEPDE